MCVCFLSASCSSVVPWSVAGCRSIQLYSMYAWLAFNTLYAISRGLRPIKFSITLFLLFLTTDWSYSDSGTVSACPVCGLWPLASLGFSLYPFPLCMSMSMYHVHIRDATCYTWSTCALC